jgi:hypothetical protein
VTQHSDAVARKSNGTGAIFSSADENDASGPLDPRALSFGVCGDGPHVETASGHDQTTALAGHPITAKGDFQEVEPDIEAGLGYKLVNLCAVRCEFREDIFAEWCSPAVIEIDPADEPGFRREEIQQSRVSRRRQRSHRGKENE